MEKENTSPGVHPPSVNPQNTLVRTANVPKGPEDPISDDAVIHIPDHPLNLPQNTGNTLLPSPIASAISVATKTTAMGIRIGTMFGTVGLATAKITTIGSLHLGRYFLEEVLKRAGSDLIDCSTSEFSRTEAEGIVESSLASLHHSLTQVSYWAYTGFHIGTSSLNGFSYVTIALMGYLNQFFGSTDSSRAIASIISLLRHEFENPATGLSGENVGVSELLMGLCGFAYLQRHCYRMVEERVRRENMEEVVWDVVVLNDGVRIDVEGMNVVHPASSPAGHHTDQRIQLVDSLTGEKLVDTIERHSTRGNTPNSSTPTSGCNSDDEDNYPEVNIKRQVMESLPPSAQVSISTSTVTDKTITVDVKGTSSLPFQAPPRLQVVEESRFLDASSSSATNSASSSVEQPQSSYRVVYKLHTNTTRVTNIQGSEGEGRPVSHVVEEINDDVSREDAARQEPLGERSMLMPPDQQPGHSPRKAWTPATPPPQALEQPEQAANQKRPRKPLPSPGSATSREKSERPQPMTRVASPPKKQKTDAGQSSEKKVGFKEALRKGPGSAISNLLHKESSSSVAPATQLKRPALVRGTSAPSAAQFPVPDRTSSAAHADASTQHSPRASYVSVHESKRDSTISQTDSFSIHSRDSPLPVSPVLLRRSSSTIIKSHSQDDLLDQQPPSPGTSLKRLKTLAGSPSIYTLKTSGSQTSLVLSKYPKSAYGDQAALHTLRRSGMVDSMFPKFHMVRNITRYMRFSSATYGATFLQTLGISKGLERLRKKVGGARYELETFAHHTDTSTGDILMASFVDQQGGSDSSGSTNTNIPLVHYISLDHESKAVVLSCRGTLGFEDVLADMMCEYDDMEWQGKSYKVHKGIHASARRLLYGGDGKVLHMLRAALESFPDYGLILTGHSLGGGVTALLGIMLAERSDAETGTTFVTSAEPHHRYLLPGCETPAPTPSTTSTASLMHVCLPAGRPIHVYCYGPPGTMSTALQKATRGLVTSIVNGDDLVPYLSLGVLHDLQGAALSFKDDGKKKSATTTSKSEVKARIWGEIQGMVGKQWHAGSPTGGYGPSGEVHDGRRDMDMKHDEWSYAALKALRAVMTSGKLVPPGEVFSVDVRKVLRRDAFVHTTAPIAAIGLGEFGIGQPATRVVLRYVRDVEGRFKEIRFGASMLLDHNPARYEDALNRLNSGLLG